MAEKTVVDNKGYFVNGNLVDKLRNENKKTGDEHKVYYTLVLYVGGGQLSKVSVDEDVYESVVVGQVLENIKITIQPTENFGHLGLYVKFVDSVKKIMSKNLL